MTMWRYWVAVLAVLGGFGCDFHAARDRQTYDHRLIPEGLGRSLPEVGENYCKAGLRFDVLYVYKLYSHWTGYTSLRFWPNGRVLLKDWNDNPPSNGDDFSGGSVGRYCVVGSTLTIEAYERPADHWIFRTYQGTLNADGTLKIVSVRWEDHLIARRMELDLAFVPLDVGTMLAAPDW